MQLAQMNIARLLAPPEDPQVAEFMNSIPAINMLGESYPGFVWIMSDESGSGNTDTRYPGHEEDERMIANLTVWDDVESLRYFVNRSGHSMYLRRRLERPEQPTTVLWWVPDGHRPDLAEGKARLEALRATGPTPEAFDLATTFPPPEPS